jgi:hypothetical protein
MSDAYIEAKRRSNRNWSGPRTPEHDDPVREVTLSIADQAALARGRRRENQYRRELREEALRPPPPRPSKQRVSFSRSGRKPSTRPPRRRPK